VIMFAYSVKDVMNMKPTPSFAMTSFSRQSSIMRIVHRKSR
jgi:hypothetical protein